jgi:hypothetical protein
MWDLWWTKWRWGRFSPSTSDSPANVHSTNSSTITITYQPGLVQQASNGRSTESPTAQLKKTGCKKIYIPFCHSRYNNMILSVINQMKENLVRMSVNASLQTVSEKKKKTRVHVVHIVRFRVPGISEYKYLGGGSLQTVI